MTTPTLSLRAALERLIETLAYTPLGIPAILAVADAKAALAAQPKLPPPVAWRYERYGWTIGPFYKSAGQAADDLRIGRGEVLACSNHYDWAGLYTAHQLQQGR